MSGLSNTEDKELVKLLRDGDMTAFDVVYRKYNRRVFQFAISILKKQEDAEEIVQEVFFKVWEKRDTLSEHLSFKSFLFTITYNTSITLIRKKIKESRYVEYLHKIQVQPDMDGPGTDIEYKELKKKVEETIDKLPKRQREIYLLSREEGLSYREIASQLGISVNTVENHMVKALRFLRENLRSSTLMMVLFCYLFL